jgi:hypothetical protein
MRRAVLALVAMVALVSFSCDEGAKTEAPKPNPPIVGNFVGIISDKNGFYDVHVYEHEGNLIYHSPNGISVVPKR